MKQTNNIKYLVIAYLTAFVGGFCVMVVEIIAGRLIARYLGISLYTWTSVIGVVLAGISFGNYIGGRIADRFHPTRALSALFILASVSCVFIPALNNLMGDLPILLHFSWPVRITIHVAIIFFLPSAILGMISPVAAKFALDQGFRPGRTIGNIYAWGAGGSIVGTFVAGFFLIAHIGTVAIVWSIAGFLGVAGLLYRIKNVFSYVWLVTFIFLVFISFSGLGWAQTMANNLFLIEADQENLIYEKDSQYSYISISKDEVKPGIYNFKIDDLVQTSMDIDEPARLDYALGYYRTFADIIKNFSSDKKDISILNLGGGGYLFPRYVEKHWPESRIEVVEIDPEITKAAICAFGLSEDSSIRIHHMDARNYIEDLTRRKRFGGEVLPFDFILCDVFSGGLAVPYHLTTVEFNEKIAQLLAPEGLYIVNLVDSSTSPIFLGAVVNTLGKTFPYTCVLLSPKEREPGEGDTIGHHTYVVIASQKELDKSIFEPTRFNSRILNERALESLKDNSKYIILTDNYAPVDNLLTEIFCIRGKNRTCSKLMTKGMQLIRENRLEESIKQFEKVLRINPNFVLAYNNIGSLKARQGRLDEAIEYYKKTLNIKPRFKPAIIGLGNALTEKGEIDEAIKMYRRMIEIEPEYPYVYVNLGDALIKQNKIDEAIKNYEKALEIEPKFEAAKINLNLAIMKKGED